MRLSLHCSLFQMVRQYAPTLANFRYVWYRTDAPKLVNIDAHARKIEITRSLRKPEASAY